MIKSINCDWFSAKLKDDTWIWPGVIWKVRKVRKVLIMIFSVFKWFYNLWYDFHFCHCYILTLHIKLYFIFVGGILKYSYGFVIKWNKTFKCFNIFWWRRKVLFLGCYDYQHVQTVKLVMVKVILAILLATTVKNLTFSKYEMQSKKSFIRKFRFLI